MKKALCFAILPLLIHNASAAEPEPKSSGKPSANVDRVIEQHQARLQGKRNEIVRQMKEQPETKRNFADYVRSGGKLTLDQWIEATLEAQERSPGDEWIRNEERLSKGGQAVGDSGYESYVSPSDEEDGTKREEQFVESLIVDLKALPVTEQAYQAFKKDGGKLPLDQYLKEAIGSAGMQNFRIATPERFAEVYGLNGKSMSPDPEAALLREVYQRKFAAEQKRLQQDPNMRSLYESYKRSGGRIDYELYVLFYSQWFKEYGPYTDFYRDERNIGKRWGDPDYEHPVSFHEYIERQLEKARAAQQKPN